jgi:hypothetical protein
MKKALLYLLLLQSLPLIAQDDPLRETDLRPLGMGGNGLSHTVLFNPALLAIEDQSMVNVNYYSRFELAELGAIGAGVCYKNKTLPGAFHISTFGSEEYRTTLLRLSGGKRMNDFFALGVSVQYVMAQGEWFGNGAAQLATDIGVYLKPLENWEVAAAVLNFPSVTVKESDFGNLGIAPLLVGIGVNWHMETDLMLTAGMMHTKETDFGASVGAEYVYSENFRLRCGLKTSPVMPSVGGAFRIPKVNAGVDIVAVYHRNLGFSLGAGVAYNF